MVEINIRFVREEKIFSPTVDYITLVMLLYLTEDRSRRLEMREGSLNLGLFNRRYCLPSSREIQIDGCERLIKTHLPSTVYCMLCDSLQGCVIVIE